MDAPPPPPRQRDTTRLVLSAFLIVWIGLLIIVIATPEADLPGWTFGFLLLPAVLLVLLWTRPQTVKRIAFPAIFVLPLLAVTIAMLTFDPDELNFSGKKTPRGEAFVGTLLGAIWGLAVPALLTWILSRDLTQPR